MLVVADDFSKFTLGAGEPFLLQLELQDKTGAVIDPGSRAFAVSIYEAGTRITRERIDGVADSDGRGAFIRFEQDGTWSDVLYGGPSLRVELDERLLRGRDQIVAGALSIRETAASLPSLASGPLGASAVRIVVKQAADGSRSFSRSVVPWVAKSDAPTPVPVFTNQPSISPANGAVGTTFTASDGAASNASGYTRRWLLSGAAIGTGTTVTPNATGSLVLEVTAHGPGGDSAPTTSAPVTVLAAGGSTVAFDPLVTRSGNVYTFTARRTANLSNAETRQITAAASTSYPPGATAADFGGSFPTATASFAAGSATAPVSITSPFAQPE